MAGTKEIKRRIKSVKSTKKITKAMELVAASKMKRAVSSMLASRLYAGYSWDILTSVSENAGEISHPFFVEKEKERTAGKTLLILISSNRGLCGAYNTQIIKKVFHELASQKETGEITTNFITIGKKGDLAMRKLGQEIMASFFELPDNLTLSSIKPVSDLIINEFSSGKYNMVKIAYTDFVSALSQKPKIKKILPISNEGLDEYKNLNKNKKIDYLFEGDKNQLISSLAEKITRMQIYQMILESNASEQSSRMMAMKNATEASGEMIDDLTLMFNKARQANITREISEISAGMVSVE